MSPNSSIKLPRFYRAVEISSEGTLLITHQFPDLRNHDVYLRNHDVVVVKPIMVGVCRSDVKEAQGNRTVRHDFGHEIVGTVEWTNASGPLSRGELVCFDPHVRLSRTSGFGELIIAKGHPSDLRRAFPAVIQEIPVEKLVFCEPTACAQHCISNLFRHLQLSRLDGLRIGIVGAGNAGSLIGLLVKYLGGTITLFNRSIARLKFLQERRIFSEHELKPLSTVIPDLFDAIIPTTSFLHSSVLRFTMQAVRPDGLILLYGGTKKGDLLPDTNLDIDWVRRQEKLVKVSWQDKSFKVGGTYGAGSEDFSRVMAIFSDISAKFPVDRLIIKEISLEELPETLQLLSSTTSQGKIVVRFDS